MAQTAVRRATGFAPEFTFYAEVTEETEAGMVTVVEGSYTVEGAAYRAAEKVKAAAVFAGYKRTAGFVSYLVEDTKAPAKQAIGFAA